MLQIVFCYLKSTQKISNKNAIYNNLKRSFGIFLVFHPLILRVEVFKFSLRKFQILFIGVQNENLWMIWAGEIQRGYRFNIRKKTASRVGLLDFIFPSEREQNIPSCEFWQNIGFPRLQLFHNFSGTHRENVIISAPFLPYGMENLFHFVGGKNEHLWIGELSPPLAL